MLHNELRLDAGRELIGPVEAGRELVTAATDEAVLPLAGALPLLLAETEAPELTPLLAEEPVHVLIVWDALVRLLL